MKKQIVTSLAVIGAVGAVAIGGTMALFTDSETSQGNIFTAGAIDLKVDHTKQTYNGEECVSNNCEVTGAELIVNGGFEAPDLATGTWAIYPDASQTSWTVEGGDGLEIQDHAAGSPHSGDQLAELDSNNSSAISQTFPTVVGGKYRLTFWHSPRPGVPEGDNTILAQVKIVSDGGLLVDQTIGAGSEGESDTTWTKYVFNFIATSTSTKVMFSDAGTSNSFGGYLDDVSVKLLDCPVEEEGDDFSFGGTCNLWNAKELEPGDTFWNFTDVKPGDWGTNVISLHVSSNDAFVCMTTENEVDNENSLVSPEVDASDAGPAFGPNGELSDYLRVVVWNDNNNGVHNAGEEVLYQGLLRDLNPDTIALATADTGYLGLSWCAGIQPVVNDADNGPISCDGSGNQNDAQTDSFVSDVVFTAVQQRNNEDFSCNEVK